MALSVWRGDGGDSSGAVVLKSSGLPSCEYFPFGVIGASITAVGDKIYVIGGQLPDRGSDRKAPLAYSSTVAKFDTKSLKWSVVSERKDCWLTSRYNHLAFRFPLTSNPNICVVGGEFYGGWGTSSSFLDDIWMFDCQRETFRKVCDIKGKDHPHLYVRSDRKVAVGDGKVFKVEEDGLWQLDVTNGEWTKLASLNRSGCQRVLWINGSLYIYYKGGGSWLPKPNTNQLIRFDVRGGYFVNLKCEADLGDLVLWGNLLVDLGPLVVVRPNNPTLGFIFDTTRVDAGWVAARATGDKIGHAFHFPALIDGSMYVFHWQDPTETGFNFFRIDMLRDDDPGAANELTHVEQRLQLL